MRCPCCGVPVPPGFARCLLCQFCGGGHGDPLQTAFHQAVMRGACSPWKALAVMLVDDAHIAGMLEMIPHADVAGHYDFNIIRPVRLWERFAARAFARGSAPEIGNLVQCAIAPHFGKPNTAAVRADVRADILEALVFVDPDIVDIIVDVSADEIRPGNEIKIAISKRTNVEPGAILMSPDVEIPAEVLARKPAQA